MDKIYKFSLKCSNFKCFEGTDNGFDFIKPINIIIGKNNSGKSTLLDLVEYVCGSENWDFDIYGHQGKQFKIIFIEELDEFILKKIFKEGTSGGAISGNHWNIGKKLIGCKFEWSYEIKKEKNNTKKQVEYLSLNPPFDLNDGSIIDKNSFENEYLKRLPDASNNPFNEYCFLRLFSDRDIQKEVRHYKPILTGHGVGLTQLFVNYLTQRSLDSNLIEEKILNDLNTIMKANPSFIRINVQEYDNNSDNQKFWEIFLREENKGDIALSHSGSGIKTILLVLCYLHILPLINENNKKLKFIYAFEELENNLHPALQRSLFLFLKEYVINNVFNNSFKYCNRYFQQ